MYANGTVLKLKDQRPPDEETDEVFAYNRVEVIGPSPITHNRDEGGWTGPDAAGVIVTPLSNHGGVLDEPFGKLRALYDVESEPTVEIEQAPPIRVVDSSSAAAGKTPEEVFAVEAPGKPPEEGQKRARTLPDVVNPATKSPLDA